MYKIVKTHTPISVFSLFTFNSYSKHNLLLPPKFKLDISKNNFVYKACYVWNTCIRKVLSPAPLDPNHFIVIPGSVENSDLTATIGYAKFKIKKHLLKIQKQGDPTEWQASHDHLY